MKKILMLVLLLLVAVPAFCQPTDVHTEPLSFFETVCSVFLPAIIAQLLVLFADASKFYSSPDWSWGHFFATNVRPFLYTTIGGIVLFIALTYIPFTKSFIEAWTGSAIVELTSAALFAAAAAIIKGFGKESRK